ncbi:MAG: hypothetical protein HY678_06500 [Chloroflexi bacterium]|nr:hypothetical protein [Chloroflexota bacterium]
MAKAVEAAIFSHERHGQALLRRRIKFVVEKGSMARLFKAAVGPDLQKELVHLLDPGGFAKIVARDEYDSWLIELVSRDGWRDYARDELDLVRWGYFAKLANICIYEIASHRELVSESDWERIKFFLHLPLDSNVFYHLRNLEPTIPLPPGWMLKGMTAEQYWGIQNVARALGAQHGVPPIWFDDAWA